MTVSRPTDDADPEEWETFLRENPDLVVMFITGDGSIHEIGYDPDIEQLSFVKDGRYGYDEETSRETLHRIVEDDGAMKVVDREDVQDERLALADGVYETPSEWVAA